MGLGSGGGRGGEAPRCDVIHRHRHKPSSCQSSPSAHLCPSQASWVWGWRWQGVGVLQDQGVEMVRSEGPLKALGPRSLSPHYLLVSSCHSSPTESHLLTEAPLGPLTSCGGFATSEVTFFIDLFTCLFPPIPTLEHKLPEGLWLAPCYIPCA